MLHLKQILRNFPEKQRILGRCMEHLKSLGPSIICFLVSGEPWETAMPEVAVDYADVGGSIMYLKFVVADRTDIEEAGRAVEEYKAAGIPVKN